MYQRNNEVLVKDRPDDLKPETTSKLRMRPATTGDLDLLLDHFEQARVASTGSGFTVEERQAHRENFEYMLTDRRFGSLVFEDGDRVVATMLFETSPEPITVRNHHLHAESPQDITSAEAMLLISGFEPAITRVHVSSITVDPKLRGQGVGQKVIEQFEGQFAGSYDVISFQTGEENTAMQKLAEKCGFTLVEVEDEKMEGYGGKYLIAIKDIGKAMEKLAANPEMKKRQEDEGANLRELLADVEGL